MARASFTSTSRNCWRRRIMSSRVAFRTARRFWDRSRSFWEQASKDAPFAMKQVTPLANHLAPDSVNRLERAAEVRHDDAKVLMKAHRLLGTVYLLGHSAEMCVVAAYFRASGFTAVRLIDRD